jgi:inhibitor of KinA
MDMFHFCRSKYSNLWKSLSFSHKNQPLLSAYSIYPASENALTVCLGDRMDAAVNARVFRLFQYLQRYPNPFWKDVIPAYCTITVVYDVGFIRKHYPSAFSWVKTEMERVLEACEVNQAALPTRKLLIPVCYDFAFGFDLKSFTKTKNLSVDQVIDLHIQQTYHVYMLGFLPGFAYMGIVDDQLALPRLATPRKLVPAGSVGIAGNQTGIYPVDSPGGWNIIGRTPVQLFNHGSNTDHQSTFVLFQPGDEVNFYAISRQAFDSFDVQNFNPFSS